MTGEDARKDLVEDQGVDAGTPAGTPADHPDSSKASPAEQSRRGAAAEFDGTGNGSAPQTRDEGKDRPGQELSAGEG